jgi:hypothetical protein
VPRTFTYMGEVELTYPGYLDVTDPAAPKTLDAVPGGTYAIAPAAGHVLADERGVLVPVEVPVPPGDGLWKAAPAPKTSVREKD